jgi:hypothetical protein
LPLQFIVKKDERALHTGGHTTKSIGWVIGVIVRASHTDNGILSLLQNPVKLRTRSIYVK